MRAFRNIRAKLSRLLSRLTGPATFISILLWMPDLAHFISQSTLNGLGLI